jgi:hypothetical protein
LEWHKKPIEVEATLIRFHSSFYSVYVQGIGAPLVSIIRYVAHLDKRGTSEVAWSGQLKSRKARWISD